MELSVFSNENVRSVAIKRIEDFIGDPVVVVPFY